MVAQLFTNHISPPDIVIQLFTNHISPPDIVTQLSINHISPPDIVARLSNNHVAHLPDMVTQLWLALPQQRHPLNNINITKLEFKLGWADA